MRNRIFVDDLFRFWETFESVKDIEDNEMQRRLIQSLYIDRGSHGLKSIIKLRSYTIDTWVSMINNYPGYLQQVRHKAVEVQDQFGVIKQHLDRFLRLYPAFRPVDIYFVIGGLNCGGTFAENSAILGSEIAMADSDMDISEINNPWLKKYCASKGKHDFVFTSIHESVHTQQITVNNRLNLLGIAVREGAADFIAEIICERNTSNAYYCYGNDHEEELKEKFVTEMFTYNYGDWFYVPVPSKATDLGYFMGYKICEAFFNRAPQKKEAISKIIKLDYNQPGKILEFVCRSGYLGNISEKIKLHLN